MLKKLLLLTSVVLTAVSCGLDYDGNTRNLYKGTVTDGAGTPLKGIPVAIMMYNDTYTDKIAYTYTDASGNYRLAAPRAKNGIPEVVINPTNGLGIGAVEAVSSVTYHNINQEALNYYTLNLGTTALASATNNVRLTISFNYDVVKKLNLIGRVTNNSIDVDFPVYIADNDNEVYPYSNYYNDLNNTFYVDKNQTLTLRYMDANEDIHEQPITIAEQELTVTIP